jgi:predicted acylesterase/phospholipase RssA
MHDAPRVEEELLLGLQRLEQALVRAHLKHPEPMLPREYQRLRYALRLAALDRFEPEAASGARGRGDVAIDQQILAPFRTQLMEALQGPLRQEQDARQRVAAAAVTLKPLQRNLENTRQALLRKHAAEFTAAELDAELCNRRLVLIAGGGGGAGFVYTGALARLQAVGITPGYIVGSSIGALLGAFVARQAQPDYRTLLDFAKQMTAAGIFAPPRLLATHGMPGLFRLHLEAFAREFQDPSGAPLRLKDLAIPYEAVVGGIRARVYDRIPALLRSPRQDGQRRLADQLAERMWQLTTLITPNLIDEIVLGRDAETRECEVVEAIGFSAAIPGVLQFDPQQRSEHMRALLDKLAGERQLAAIVDGGVANNVPAKVAWRGLHAGRIGTRNAFYLAFDCFRPQADRRHVWLWPVTQAVQLQMPANRPYFDWLLQFRPTLSPINLLPTPEELDQSWEWGWQQMDAILPMITKALEPIPRQALPWG